MPKRSAEEKLERYRKKLRKLEEKALQKARRVQRVIESSESENECLDEARTTHEPELESSITPTSGPGLVDAGTEPQNADLDPEILIALGGSAEEVPKFGPPIHRNLVKMWQNVLKKGMSKEDKEKVMKEYPIPENCPLLQAPKLNAEIIAAITDVSRNRDKKMESSQQQLGVGLTALNRALSLITTNSDKKLEVVKLISDGCRILCDLHFTETQARKKLLVPGLEKSFLNLIKETERDDTLFGSNLSDQIKASKVIEKQGLQIKKTVAAAKTPTPTTQSTIARPRHQENWTGPPRYASTNKGGRGGYRKTNPGHRRALPPPPNKPPSQAKPRGRQ